MLDPGVPSADVTFERAFPRVHARALGVAIGFTAGSALFLLTAFHVVFGVHGIPIGLLGQYFRYYQVTWPGALVGFVWAFAAGFIGGWLLAFIRNTAVAFWLLLMRTRAELSQRRNFLDHIR